MGAHSLAPIGLVPVRTVSLTHDALVSSTSGAYGREAGAAPTRRGDQATRQQHETGHEEKSRRQEMGFAKLSTVRDVVG